MLKAFEKALSKMSIGLSALQIASLAVNLDVMGQSYAVRGPESSRTGRPNFQFQA
eukprot:COSAG01_NODE_987_length_12316_cov_167.856348_5_plen_55_part_00